MQKKMSNSEWARQFNRLLKVDAGSGGHNDHFFNSNDGKIAEEKCEVI
jgi:hypothetical protein